MEQIIINSEEQFMTSLTTAICCVEHNSARHVVNAAGVGRSDKGGIFFMVETIAGQLHVEDQIELFIFNNPREAQRFLIFEPVEFGEDEILNTEIIED